MQQPVIYNDEKKRFFLVFSFCITTCYLNRNNQKFKV